MENTRHFENLRHPQTLHKEIKLMCGRRPSAKVRAIMCRAKGWKDPLSDQPDIDFRPKGKFRAEPQRYLDTSAVLLDHGLTFPEALELGAPREDDSDDDVDPDMV